MTADLLDSSVLIDFLRNAPGRAADHLDGAFREAERPFVTEPVAMELLAGAGRPILLAQTEGLLASLRLARIDPRLDYRDGAALYRASRSNGHTIRKMNDCLIAAVALRNGARVVHRDGDFEAIAAVSSLRTLDLR